jgi:hypothetical protein
MFNAFESEFERRLKSRLTEIHERKVAGLVQGFAKDYSEYRQHVGYLAALNDFGAVLNEISSDMNQEEKD